MLVPGSLLGLEAHFVLGCWTLGGTGFWEGGSSKHTDSAHRPEDVSVESAAVFAATLHGALPCLVFLCLLLQLSGCVYGSLPLYA